MQLTSDDIKEFQGIWKEVFDEDISEGYARQRASTFLDLLILLLKHEKRKDMNKNNNNATT